MRKIYLIFHGRFPSEKAASLFTAKNAEAFAQQGIEVEVVVPRRKGVQSQTAYQYFGVETNFKISELGMIDFLSQNFLGLHWPRKVAFYLNFVSFSLACFFFIRKKAKIDDLVYSNESLPLLLISFVHRNTFYELHDFPEGKFGLFSWLLKRTRFILVHNRWKMQKIQEMFPNFPPSKFFLEPNAVDLRAFDLQESKESARQKLSLPLEKKIVVYTGHLYRWKGVYVLAEAAKLLAEDFWVIFVGGTEKDISKLKDESGVDGRIKIVGHRPHAEMPLWQKAADVLVLPNTATEKISALYTSPMKLFEYMASRRPIVASDIPSIREILSEENAIIVLPDSPTELARGIEVAVSSPNIGKLVERAFKDVSEHTWEKRAQRVIAFIQRNS